MRAAVDHNAAAALRHFARHAPGAVLRDGPTLLVAAASDHVGAFHNAAMSCGATASTTLAAARAFGAEHGRELVLWTSAQGELESLARAEGLPQRAGVVGMAIERPPAWPPGVEVVADEAGVDEFAEVHRGLFGSAAPVAHFASPGVLLAPEATGVVARREGRVVACALVIVSGTTAGVYWVATARDARRLGFGRAVTAAAVNVGFAHGARVVVLQATQQGSSVYRGLGFIEVNGYGRWVVGGVRGVGSV